MQKDKMIKLCTLVIIFFVCGCLYSCKDNQKTQVVFDEQKTDSKEQLTVDSETDMKQEDKQQEALLCVYICGEVKTPGVYQVKEGTRLYQVLEMAGGILETGANDYLNLAECVADGEKIDVPTKEEVEQLDISQDESASKLININTANEETLTTLPGIGASKAKSIISYRESQDGFKSIEELMEIEGIKEGVFNKVKDLITVK